MNEAQRKIIEAEARTWTVADERGAAKVLLAFQRFRREVGTDAAAALRHAVDFIGGHLETGICRRVRDDLGGEQDALPADA